MPLPRRALTSLLVRYNGSCILVDCGEATQIALRRAEWSPKPIDVMCFTHYHADHISGLPGMLLTMGNADRTEPLLMIAGDDPGPFQSYRLRHHDEISRNHIIAALGCARRRFADRRRYDDRLFHRRSDLRMPADDLDLKLRCGLRRCAVRELRRILILRLCQGIFLRGLFLFVRAV